MYDIRILDEPSRDLKRVQIRSIMDQTRLVLFLKPKQAYRAWFMNCSKNVFEFGLFM